MKGVDEAAAARLGVDPDNSDGLNCNSDGLDCNSVGLDCNSAGLNGNSDGLCNSVDLSCNSVDLSCNSVDLSCNSDGLVRASGGLNRAGWTEESEGGWLSSIPGSSSQPLSPGRIGAFSNRLLYSRGINIVNLDIPPPQAVPIPPPLRSIFPIPT